MNFALADIHFLTPNSHNSTKRRWYEMFLRLFEPYFSTDLGKRWRKCCACYHPRYFLCWYWICQTLAIFWHKFSKIWLTSVKHSIAGSWIFFKCGKTRNLEQPQSCTAERKSNQRKPLGNNTSATGYAIHRVCKRYCRRTKGSLVKLYPAGTVDLFSIWIAEHGSFWSHSAHNLNWEPTQNFWKGYALGCVNDYKWMDERIVVRRSKKKPPTRIVSHSQPDEICPFVHSKP